MAKPALAPKIRLRLLEDVFKNKLSVSVACKTYGVSRFTFYKWAKKYQAGLTRSENLKALRNTQRRVLKFSRRLPEVMADQIKRLALANPEWSKYQLAEEVKKILGEDAPGVHGVYNVLRRIGITTPEERKTLAVSGRRKLNTDLRAEMIRRYKAGESVSQICRDYQISRFSFYKWYRRWCKGGENPESLTNRKAIYHREHLRVAENLEEKIKEIILKAPHLSKYSIAQELKRWGSQISPHGVYNVLLRLNLNKPNFRVAYALSRQPQVAVSVGTVDQVRSVLESFVPNLAPAPPPVRAWSLGSLLKISIFSFFGLVIFSLAVIFWINLLKSVALVSSIGFIFATIALVTGSFFFLYSLKYYVTIAVVLSFSQQKMAGGKRGNTGLLAWILGRGEKNGGGISRTSFKSAGLESNLDHVTLTTKPYVSIHIPFYNEKNVVERVIAAVTSFDYPEYEVILCDDSTDETSAMIRSYQSRCLLPGEQLKITSNPEAGWELSEVEVKPGVTLKHLHRNSRSGFKGGALKLALTLVNSRTEFITVFDADFVPYPDSLTLFLKYFKVQNGMSEDFSGSNLAAVQGYQWHVLNKSENWITRGVRSEYAGSYVIERSGEEVYGGLKQISGSVYMIRRKPLEEVGWATSITEDFELTLKLYAAGYKVVYTPYIQAPAECVSTLKRLIRQRMRWAEGHSFNIKKMFTKLVTNPKLTGAEKLEFFYLSPYYLQAFFFLVGTFSWLVSETLFHTRLPFWSSLWGWSLVFTNLIALPLMNAVGMFLEESEEKDYLGIFSFVMLSYLVVPFQAFAAVKGFLETSEGPWFRTPKTGRITDVFTRGAFYRFISGVLPKMSSGGEGNPTGISSPYLALSTANNRFENFNITKNKHAKSVTTVVLVFLLTVSTLIYSLAPGISQNNVPISYATDLLEVNFENGNFTPFTGTETDGTDLSVTTGAKLNGNYGMSMFFDDANQKYAYSTITARSVLRYRFYIDPNSITMANNDTFWVQTIIQNNSPYDDISFVRLRYLTASGYRLLFVGRDDAVNNVTSDFMNISDAPHYVEVKAVRATNATSKDGSYQWWVDGVDQGTGTGIDNYNIMADYGYFVVLGAWDMTTSGTSGTVYLDDYKINDDGGVIGAVPENLWVFLLVVPFIPAWLGKRRVNKKRVVVI